MKRLYSTNAAPVVLLRTFGLQATNMLPVLKVSKTSPAGRSGEPGPRRNNVNHLSTPGSAPARLHLPHSFFFWLHRPLAVSIISRVLNLLLWHLSLAQNLVLPKVCGWGAGLALGQRTAVLPHLFTPPFITDRSCEMDLFPTKWFRPDQQVLAVGFYFCDRGSDDNFSPY